MIDWERMGPAPATVLPGVGAVTSSERPRCTTGVELAGTGVGRRGRPWLARPGWSPCWSPAVVGSSSTPAAILRQLVGSRTHPERGGPDGRLGVDLRGVVPDGHVLRRASTSPAMRCFWDGTKLVGPGPGLAPMASLNSVSCTSSTFCVALSSQEAVTFDGQTWSAPVAVGPAPTGPPAGSTRSRACPPPSAPR